MPGEKLMVKEEESFESLLPRLTEIKTWQKDINAAKGDKAKASELRKNFKAIFGVPFGQKLVAELNRLEKREITEKVENKKEKKEKPSKPLEVVAEKAEELQTEIHEQQSLEAAAQTVSSPELNNHTLHIDEQKKEVVVNAIDWAEAVALKASRDVKRAEEADNQNSGELTSDGEEENLDEESLRQKILSTREAVLAEIEAGYKAELEANNLELEKKIGRAASFDDLLDIIKESGGIQGTKEFFTPEMLLNVLESIRSKRSSLLAATSALGFREAVGRILSSENIKGDSSKEAEVSKCDSLEDFISLFNKFPELAILGGDVKNINEYVSYFSREVKLTEQLYLSNDFRNAEHLNGALNFITRRHGLRDSVAQYIIKKNGFHFMEAAHLGLSEKDNALRRRVSDCPDFNSLIALVQSLTEADFAVDSFDIGEMVENLKKVEKKYQERLAEGNTVYTEPSFIPNDYGLKEQTKKIWENMVMAAADKNTETGLQKNPEGTKDEIRIVPQALEYFHSLGLNDEDLFSIPDLNELNGVSQLLIAKSLKNLALERANRKVAKQQAEASATAKGFWSKLGTGISNTFKIGRQKKEAILEQAHGGLAEHKIELTRLVDWAQNFNLKEVEVEEGKFRADFTGHIDLENINEEQAALVQEMNENANWLASCAKEHRLFTYTPEPKGSKAHQEYYRAKRAYDDSREKMSALLSNDLKLSEASVLRAINKMDANVNMVQFMSANPELEKDWSEMLKNKSVLAKAFAKDNWKFIASGYAGRMALGSVLGFVAGPVVATAIGYWRGQNRGRQELRRVDKALDKKDLSGDSPLLLERKSVLKSIQALVPTEYFTEEERVKWLTAVATPEQASLYSALLLKFKDLDARWRKEEEKNKGIHNKNNKKEYRSGKNIERKILSADILMSKLRDLIDKAQQAEGEKRTQLLFQLSRRVDFSKDLADNGLINFGSMEERSARMLDFYQLLSQGQILQLDKNVPMVRVAEGEPEDVYENSNVKELKELNERAEDLLNSLEYFAEMQLDKNRKSFMIKKIVFGAITGGVFATSGYMLHKLSGGWVEDKISSGYRFIADNTRIDEVLAAAGKAVHLDQVSAAIDGFKHQAGEYINNLTGGHSAEAVAPAAGTQAAASENLQNSANSGATVDSTLVNNSAPVLETPKPAAAPTAWSDQISNEGLKAGQHDSVWLSTKNIFESHASELGYKGDINDAAALHRWTELQTNRALADSGDITNKVFVGNKVMLEKSGDGFTVRVEAGSGVQPGHLPDIKA